MQLKKKRKLRNGVTQIDCGEIRCSETDQNLPELCLLRSQNQGMKSNEKTGDITDEMKRLKEIKFRTKVKTVKGNGMT